MELNDVIRQRHVVREYTSQSVERVGIERLTSSLFVANARLPSRRYRKSQPFHSAKVA